MSERKMVALDGNEATASVAHRINEVIAIYPITPSSNMGEFADEWSARGMTNIWGSLPQVVEMQSEAGAAAAVHGSLQAGALTTTFTASQGLLLMIPTMYKIAGELTSYCMHVSARTVATHALSIFGDHSDVMAVRSTGFGLLASGSVQEAHDFAAIGQMASLASRIPFLHFFDGFRTSHEVAKIEMIDDDSLHQLMDEELIRAHRQRAMTPDRPTLRGTSQNPDVFFQVRETCNPFYDATPQQVRDAMNRFAQVIGRQYDLFEYVGHPQAERVVVAMGSAIETAHETVEYLVDKGEAVGLLKVRLYRPFSVEHFINALPSSVRSIAVLDRTKEPGAVCEPMHLDILSALQEAKNNGTSPFSADPHVVGGRYGLSSKEFTPGCVKAVLDNLAAETPRNHFTVGIEDDVTHLSLPVDDEFDVEPESVNRSVFFGLGSDGTVGANKNSIKIIGLETDFSAQGYFVYDSKKAGAITISHLRFGPKQIRSPYLIKKADFVACHQFVFLEKYDVLDFARPGAVFLLNAPYGSDEIWDHLPREVQQQIVDKDLQFYVIDAYEVAKLTGMGVRINTIMQTCFFAISGVLPRDEAIDQIKKAIKKTYGNKGDEVVRRNFAAVDGTLEHLHQVTVPSAVTSGFGMPPTVSPAAPEFVQDVTAVIMKNKGDTLPVSKFPADGVWPLGTTQWEKRNIALTIPVWNEDLCIQCNKCAMICPHAAIRVNAFDESYLADAPETFKAIDARGKDLKGMKYTVQVAPEDCTGCELCVVICPAKDKANPKRKSLEMAEQMPLREPERENFEYFLSIPPVDRTLISRIDVKGAQFFEPLFEFSGACSGCGETPYIKLLTQLYGDRLLIGNATGCSSIYGGNLPTTPYSCNADGRGPTWNNSLFEDAAEFSYGLRLAVDKQTEMARELVAQLAGTIGDELVNGLLGADQSDEAGVKAQRERVVLLAQKLQGLDTPEAKRLVAITDYLVRKSVWGVGGDGWAYDIGYGGLDHVLASGRDINLLVLDTEVYSNTGGQASKATPLGAAAKFAMAGKALAKKDLGMMAMSYGNVYVAKVAMGAKDTQTVRAFREAESFPGPSLIIAYSHCIAHGYNLIDGPAQQARAVDSGIWPLYRFDPRRVDDGQPPLKLDSGEPKIPVADYMLNETRFRIPEKLDPKRFQRLMANAQKVEAQRYAVYQQLANLTVPKDEA